MYAFVKLTGGVGRAFEKHCADLGKEPREMIEAMLQGFVAEKNMDLPPPENHGEGLDRFTSIYLKMRNTKLALQKMADEETGRIKADMEELSGYLLNELNTSGVESMRTRSATFYKQKVLKPSCSDWSVFYDWIKKEDAFEFLERRVTRKAVEDYLEEHGAPPPGISTLVEYEVVVRKGKDT